MIQVNDLDGLVKKIDDKLALNPSRLTATFEDSRKCTLSYMRPETSLSGEESVVIAEPTNADQVITQIHLIRDARKNNPLSREHPNIRNYLPTKTNDESFYMVPF